MQHLFRSKLFLLFLIFFYNSIYAQTKNGAYIQKLIDDADDGSSVNIPDGTYLLKETISIEERENLKIIFGKEAKIINSNGESSIMELYNCVNIHVLNGSFSYNTANIKNDYAMHFEECEGVLFDKCEVKSGKAIAFDCYSSDKIGITNCYIHDSKAMLNLELVSNAKITGNKIENTPVFPKEMKHDDESRQLLKTIPSKNKIITGK
jgi:hypothetical protein